MWRSGVIFSFIVLWTLIVIGRLFFWQVLSYEKLSAVADQQHFISLPIPAIRGEILAKDGSVLVTNQPAYLVYAEPKKIKDKKLYAKTLSQILKTPVSTISAQIESDNQLWVPLGRRVDEENVEKIKQLKIEGVGFEKEGKRYYPEASMSAQLLGFVALDERGQDKGYFGLEGFYDKELKGREGFLRQEKDPYGFPIVIGEGERIEAENGRTLKLNIDKVVQFTLEERLKNAIEKFGAKGGLVAVMEPNTGAILGLASYPSYDPSKFNEYTNDIYKNPVISYVYEPGSTFKSLIMAAALNEKAVTPQTIVDETGPVTIGEYTIRTWDNKYHGKITMTEVLQHSSNVGMVFVANKLRREKTVEYLKRFGFGDATNIDLEEEEVPDLRADQEWKEIDLATASFGQGIAVTPIQMLRAVAVLANGGKLVEPHVVSEVIDSYGNSVVIKPKVVREVIKPSTAKVITEMLVSSVEAGEAHYKLPKGYRIAGKTGTAQIPVLGHYDPDKTIASFVGYAPADNPKFVMLVTINEPTSSQWGSETAAPLFFDIAKELLNYYKVSPHY